MNISELRDFIAEAVSRTISEAKKSGKKPKETPAVSDEAREEQQARYTKGLPGYNISKQNDFSPPLGDKNLSKRQGASGMGNWTSETINRKIKEMQVRKLVAIIVNEEVRKSRGK